ncbi:MAG: glycosyltransferase family 2 protein [Muribaculaceae bacterium]|nr:glycosyltransferase family 2 protein [Muribaculaceae bacterium]
MTSSGKEHIYISAPLDSHPAPVRQRIEIPVLCIVVPCLNEEEVLPFSHRRLNAVLAALKNEGKISADSYILYVDDGSTDTTWEIISGFADCFPETVGGLRLSANVGHQNALVAGIEAAVSYADIVVTIDADMQDDPGAIGAMVEEYMKGYEIVYGVRSDRTSDSRVKRGLAQAHYKLMAALGASTVYNHSDYRLMSRRAIESLVSYEERNLYLRGIVPMLGFAQSKVYFTRARRVAGKTKYPFGRMFNFAADGITSFSVRPVRMVFVTGIVFLLVAFAILIYVLVRYLGGYTIEGWSSLMVSVWLCSGVLLMALGVTGEYIGKIYTEVKHRPRYHLEQTAGRASDAGAACRPTHRPNRQQQYP